MEMKTFIGAHQQALLLEMRKFNFLLPLTSTLSFSLPLSNLDTEFSMDGELVVRGTQ